LDMVLSTLLIPKSCYNFISNSIRRDGWNFEARRYSIFDHRFVFWHTLDYRGYQVLLSICKIQKS